MTINNENYTGKIKELINTKHVKCGDMRSVARKRAIVVSADGTMCVFMLAQNFTL